MDTENVISSIMDIAKSDSGISDVKSVKAVKTASDWLGVTREWKVQVTANYDVQPSLTEREMDLLYSIGYGVTDQIQNTFPNSISMRPTFDNIGRTFFTLEYFSRQIQRFNENPPVYCAAKGKPPIRVRDVSALEKCDNWMILEGSIRDKIETDRLYSEPNLGFIPVTTFFLTSFGVIALVYVGMGLYIVARISRHIGSAFVVISRILDVRDHPFLSLSIMASPLLFILILLLGN